MPYMAYEKKMKAIQFCKIDNLRSKTNHKFIALFTIIALFLSFRADITIFFGSVYMVFCAIVFASQPFMIEATSESGFINMLPGNKRARVMGRFLYSTMLVFICVITGTLIMLFASIHRELPLSNMLPFFLTFLAIGFIVCYVQNTLFYAIGKGKNQQLMGIIRILPGFIVFFSSISLVDKIENNSVSYKIIVWTLANPLPASLLLLGISFVFFILGTLISTFIVEKRDFN